MKETYCNILDLDAKTCTQHSIERACARYMTEICETFIKNPPGISQLEERLKAFDQIVEIYHGLRPSESNSIQNKNVDPYQILRLNTALCSSQVRKMACLNRIREVCEELIEKPIIFSDLKECLEKVTPVLRAYETLRNSNLNHNSQSEGIVKPKFRPACIGGAKIVR
jgi:hypothetical protein